MKCPFFASKKFCAASIPLEQQDALKATVKHAFVLDGRQEERYVYTKVNESVIGRGDEKYCRNNTANLYSSIAIHQHQNVNQEKDFSPPLHQHIQAVLKKSRELLLTSSEKTCETVQKSYLLNKENDQLNTDKITPNAINNLLSSLSADKYKETSASENFHTTQRTSQNYSDRNTTSNVHAKVHKHSEHHPLPQLANTASCTEISNAWEMRQHLGCVSNYVMLLLSIITVVIFGFSNMLYAADGRIYFTGEIVDATCLVKNEVQVVMPNTPADFFKKIGDASQTTPFNVELSQCPDAVHRAKISFKATTSSENSELIQTTGTAKGVAIELIDAANEQRLAFKNGESSPSTFTKLKTSGTTNLLSFGARYVSTAPSVKSGSASAFADFTVTYE